MCDSHRVIYLGWALLMLAIMIISAPSFGPWVVALLIGSGVILGDCGRHQWRQRRARAAANRADGRQ